MDFSELNKKYSNADIKAFDPQTKDFINQAINNEIPKIWQIVIKVIYILLLIFFTLRFLAVAFINYSHHYSWVSIISNSLINFFVLLLFLAVFVAYRLALKNEKLNIYCYLKFAQANNLIYFSRDPLAKIQEANNIYIPISGLIFNVGFGQKFRDLIGNNDLSIGNYQFLTTNGKTTKVHKWVVASVKLSRNLPHIVLDSKQNNELGISNLPESFKRDQRVDAEPALTDYFTLYAPQGYQIDSLSFVAPDVIAVLRDDFVKFDLEIIDNTLYIYHMGELKNNQIQDVFQKIHNLLSPLETNINNYVDDRSQQGAYINGLNAIAPQGRLLQKSHVKQIMISILFVIIAVIQLCLGGNH